MSARRLVELVLRDVLRCRLFLDCLFDGCTEAALPALGMNDVEYCSVAQPLQVGLVWPLLHLSLSTQTGLIGCSCVHLCSSSIL